MPTSYLSPFVEGVWIQTQTALTSVNNSSGVWNQAGAQFVRVMDDSLHMQAEEPKIAANWKHRSASQLAKINGRKSGQFSLSCPVAPSGTQAVPPDCDPLLQGIFGGAGVLGTTVGGNSSWNYNIYDRVAVPFTLLGFIHGATAGHRYATGCVAQKLSIDFNGNILGLSVSGVSYAVTESETFSVLDTYGKGGLSSYPTEPASYSVSGSLINGFGPAGLQMVGAGTTIQLPGMCDQLSIEFDTGMSLKNDFVDSARAQAVIFGRRNITGTLAFTANDSAAFAQLKQWSRTNTPVQVTYFSNGTAGYRVAVTLNGVQFNPGTYSDAASGTIQVSFGQSSTSVTPGSSNDIQLAFY